MSSNNTYGELNYLQKMVPQNLSDAVQNEDKRELWNFFDNIDNDEQKIVEEIICKTFSIPNKRLLKIFGSHTRSTPKSVFEMKIIYHDECDDKDCVDMQCGCGRGADMVDVAEGSTFNMNSIDSEHFEHSGDSEHYCSNLCELFIHFKQLATDSRYQHISSRRLKSYCLEFVLSNALKNEEYSVCPIEEFLRHMDDYKFDLDAIQLDVIPTYLGYNSLPSHFVEFCTIYCLAFMDPGTTRYNYSDGGTNFPQYRKNCIE